MGGESTSRPIYGRDAEAAPRVAVDPGVATAWIARVARGSFDAQAIGGALRTAPESLWTAVMHEVSTRWGIAAAHHVVRAARTDASPSPEAQGHAPSTRPTQSSASASLKDSAFGTHVNMATVLPPSTAPSALERARHVAQLGHAHMAALRTALLPAYRRAIAATDTTAVRALVMQIVGGVAQILEAQAHIVQLVPQADASPRAANASTAETDPGAPDDAALASLLADKAQLDDDVIAGLRELALQVSPQMFGDQPTAGTVEAVGTAHNVERFVYEAGLVVQLLEEADAIQALAAPVDAARGTSERPAEGALTHASDRLAGWRSRPINFYFLARTLKQRGVWELLQGAKATDGQTLAAIENKVAKQAEQTGTTADVGSWDVDEASTALAAGLPSWVVTESDAERMFSRLAEVEPRARAGLIKQLHRMALLDRLCTKLPWGMVKQLWESIDDAEASKLLEPYWKDRGGGESLGQMLSHHWYTRALDKTLNFATFGAKPKIDAAYEARDAGLISDDAYWDSVTKAAGGAAFVAAAMMATGGIAGEFAAGATEGLGGASSTIISGAVGGAAGSVGGHFAGDIYSQALEGKQGFDPLGDYGKSLALGGLAGTIAAPLGLAAAKYLPVTLRTWAQSAAVAHPLWTRVLEAARFSGVGVATRVRMTVEEFTNALGGGAPPGFRFAHATAAVPREVAAANPGAGVVLTIRPLQDLNARPEALRRDGEPQLEVENVSLADQVQEHFDEMSQLGGGPGPDLDGSFAGEGSALGEGSPEAAAVQPRRSARDAGVVPNPGDVISDLHHVLPQAERKWFAARGVDVDRYCIKLSEVEHRAQHGGGSWRLAREVAKTIPTAEWNAAMMRALRSEEALLRRATGDSRALLDEDQILDVAINVMRNRGISTKNFWVYPR
jgi:hypothetical protein